MENKTIILIAVSAILAVSLAINIRSMITDWDAGKAELIEQARQEGKTEGHSNAIQEVMNTAIRYNQAVLDGKAKTEDEEGNEVEKDIRLILIPSYRCQVKSGE